MSAAKLRLTDQEWLKRAQVYMDAHQPMSSDDWAFLAQCAGEDNRPLIAHSILMVALDAEQRGEMAQPVPIRVLSESK